MSKNTKLTSLPKLDEWKAPWEVTRDAEGNETPIPEEEQVIDKPKLKKYLHGLLGDKISLRTSLDETTASVEELEQRVGNATDPKDIEKLQQELATAKQERDAAAEKAAGNANSLKWEIALEKGLTKVQAKRLVGTTREELEQDADDLIQEFGGGSNSEGGEGGSIRSAPRRVLNNAGDPETNAKPEGKKKTPDEVAAEWLANR